MKWIKLGKIFECEAINEDLLTHASNPLAVHLNDDVFRVFFSGRNIQNKSSVGFVDIDIFTKDIKNISKETTFKYGDDNSFYSHGVSIGNMYTVGDRNYILFMGLWIFNFSCAHKSKVNDSSLQNKTIDTRIIKKLKIKKQKD